MPHDQHPELATVARPPHDIVRDHMTLWARAWSAELPVFRKLDIRSRVELARLAVEREQARRSA
jgi:hypothetical protein